MGVGPSRTRKLTVENDKPSSVIKVSEDVVERLKGSEKSQPGVRSIANSTSVNSGQEWPQFHGNPQFGLPTQQYFHEPILTSLQIRQEKEAALKKNDQYWESRISNMEKVHGEMHEVMEEEYNRAIDDLKPATVRSCKIVPCQKSKKAVMDCYKKYPKEPMRCAREVEAFAECVDGQRAILIANKG